MPVLKFRNFENVDRFEKDGKGINWRFKPDESYFMKALRFSVRVSPRSVYIQDL